MSRFSLSYDMVWGQFYILPAISVTYDRLLNGSYELSLWWFNRVLSVRYTK